MILKISGFIEFRILQIPPQAVGKDEGDGAGGERSYLSQFLNKSSDIEKESLGVLKQIQLQLRMDSERIDRVSRLFLTFGGNHHQFTFCQFHRFHAVTSSGSLWIISQCRPSEHRV
jgi:hypothetical protein